MAISTRKEALEHMGHELEVAEYGNGDSVTIECLTCGEVLIAFEDLENNT